MSNLQRFVLTFLLLITTVAHSGDSASPNVKTVERFMAAFNSQDSGAMAGFVAHDIEWLSIAGKQVTAEASGKGDLVESMNAYFESCPSCRSELSSVISTASRVSAVEDASWQGDSGPETQRALSVYEFSDGLISRVYYFPAEK